MVPQQDIGQKRGHYKNCKILIIKIESKIIQVPFDLRLIRLAVRNLLQHGRRVLVVCVNAHCLIPVKS